MQYMIGELQIETRNETSFQCDILCIITLVTLKLHVVCGRSTYRTTALLSEMSIFCVRAGCKIQMMSYGSKNNSQSLSDEPFVCT